MTLLEPDVALTDFALAIECGLFAVWLSRYSFDRSVRGWFVVFFAALGIGSLLGGLTHGFFPDPQSIYYRAIWRSTLLVIGLAAFACWVIGAHLLFPEKIVKRFQLGAGSIFVLYVAAILFVTQSFAVAIVHYLPPAVFLLAAFTLNYVERRAGYLIAGIAGLLLSFVAAAIQQFQFELNALSLTYNALYHLVQGMALFLIFWAARGRIREVS